MSTYSSSGTSIAGGPMSCTPQAKEMTVRSMCPCPRRLHKKPDRTPAFGVADLGERRRLAGTTSRSPLQHMLPRTTSDATPPRYS